MSDLTHPDDPTLAPLRAPDVYQLVDTADGRIVYFIGNQKQLDGMWRALDQPEKPEDRDFNDMRMFHSAPDKAMAASALTNDAFAAHPTAEIIDRMAAHPTAGRTRQPRPATHFSGTPSMFARVVGRTGEHTDEMLAEFSHDADTITAHHERGLVRSPDAP